MLMCLKSAVPTNLKIIVIYCVFQRVMVFPMLFPDSKIELKLEKREPLKGRAKTPVTLKQRRVEHNQVSSVL